jgi:hypothetical protein
MMSPLFGLCLSTSTKPFMYGNPFLAGSNSDEKLKQSFMRAQFEESKRRERRHGPLQALKPVSGCIFLQQPFDNLRWCYTHSRWPPIWTCLWLLLHCLSALFRWNRISNALQFVETDMGDAMFHITGGRARFTEPKYFPCGFFETCIVLRPSNRLQQFARDALVEQTMQLQQIQVWWFALPRLLWQRFTKPAVAIEAFVAEEPRVSGPAFLVALAWRRALASASQTCAVKSAVPQLDMALSAGVYPSGLMPHDLLKSPLEHFSLESSPFL